uniref:DBF4-type domain-containing protein n=1 Tax=Plectus sambesii TaxID=2011161 RepID=A0A914V5G5_9BILA
MTVLHKGDKAQLMRVGKKSSARPRHDKKPLKLRSFVLEIENRTKCTHLKNAIESLGGTIVDVYSEPKPYCLVSDHPQAGLLDQSAKKQKNWDLTMSESSGRLSATDKPTGISEQVLNRVPMLLRVAVRSGVRVFSYARFLELLDTVKKNARAAQKNVLNAPRKSSAAVSEAPRPLSGTFIKFQDVHGEYSPAYKEFVNPTNWFPVYLNNRTGRSIFHKGHGERATDNQLPTTSKAETQGPSARPRLSVRKSPRKTQKKPQIRSGYCEICGLTAQDIDSHLMSDEHRKWLTPTFYSEVDDLIGSNSDLIDVAHPGAEFLRLNHRQPDSLQEDLFESSGEELAW